MCAYFALLFSLPIIIYQGYAFIVPALNSSERRIAFPLMAAAPALFMLGVVFAYLIVLKPAVHFLQGYNSEQFNILVQAKTFYQFEILTMLGIGLAFQLPLGLLALHRLGVINGSTLTTTLALRYGDHRCHRGGDAWGRSGHDRTRDGATGSAVPGKYRDAQDRRST